MPPIAPALALLLTATPGIDYDSMAKEARSILSELVAVDTTNPPGNEAKAVALLANRLKAAKIPYEVTSFAKGRDNLVARLAGDGSAKPVLLLAHLDVVGTKDQNWASPPHTMAERGGFLYGRGVSDDLGMAAVDLSLILALKRAKVPLHRDLIVAFTGDEESGGAGARWLIAHKKSSINAEVAFNEGGGPLLGEDGKVGLVQIQTTEKTYQDFKLTAEGVTGHSSAPLPHNAIDEVARALIEIADHPFPERLLPVTESFFAGRAQLESDEVGDALSRIAHAKGDLPGDALAVIRTKPSLEALLHTTCVPTVFNAGTRVNALPSKAEANLNCRIMPDETVDSVKEKLQELAGALVKVQASAEFGSGPASPLDGPGPQAVLAAGRGMWPKVKITPTISAGADDSRFLRAADIRAYGFAPIPMTDADGRRAHGIDERIPVSGLRTGVELFERLIAALNVPAPTAPPPAP